VLLLRRHRHRRCSSSPRRDGRGDLRTVLPSRHSLRRGASRGSQNLVHAVRVLPSPRSIREPLTSGSNSYLRALCRGIEPGLHPRWSSSRGGDKARDGGAPWDQDRDHLGPPSLPTVGRTASRRSRLLTPAPCGISGTAASPDRGGDRFARRLRLAFLWKLPRTPIPARGSRPSSCTTCTSDRISQRRWWPAAGSPRRPAE